LLADPRPRFDPRSVAILLVDGDKARRATRMTQEDVAARSQNSLLPGPEKCWLMRDLSSSASPM